MNCPQKIKDLRNITDIKEFKKEIVWIWNYLIVENLKINQSTYPEITARPPLSKMPKRIRKKIVKYNIYDQKINRTKWYYRLYDRVSFWINKLHKFK